MSLKRSSASGHPPNQSTPMNSIQTSSSSLSPKKLSRSSKKTTENQLHSEKSSFEEEDTQGEDHSQEDSDTTHDLSEDLSADVNFDLAEDDESIHLDASANRFARDEDDAGDVHETSIARYDPMQAYMREIQRYPLLSPEREHELSTRYYQTQDVRTAHTLISANLRLVVKIAYEYRRAYKNIMDLVQEGNIGLMQAVKKYDPTRGVKLSSYAAWWIRAYILRFILNNWRMVKLGTTQAQRKLFFNLSKEKQRLLAMGIDPTPKAIADRLHVNEDEVIEMDVRLGSSEASLDAPVGDSDGRPISRVDLMPSMGENVDVTLAEAELKNTLHEKLDTFRATLKGKELEIFDLRLASADEPLTLQELGDRFGVSRERVRQLEARLVGKLRQHFKTEIEEHENE